MNIKCSGKFIPSNSNILTGLGTKLSSEIYPGDSILVNGVNIKVLSVISDNSVIVDRTIVLDNNTDFYITAANPQYKLSNKSMIKEKDYYYYEYLSEIMSNWLYGGQVLAGPMLCKLYPVEGKKTTRYKLPTGYNYTNCYNSLSLAKISLSSSVLSLPDYIAEINTSAGSNVLQFNNYNSPHIYFIVGVSYVIDDDIYTVTHKYSPTSSATFVEFDKTFSKNKTRVRIYVKDNYNDLYQVGSVVQVNGKLYTVLSSSGSTIQLNYPIVGDLADGTIVTVRLPLLATTVGTNSLVFSNIDPPMELLARNNIVIINDIRDESNIAGDSINYAEIRTVARNFNTHIATYENNSFSFTGVVSIGVADNGFAKIRNTIIVDSFNRIADSSIYNSLLDNGSVIKLDNTLHTVSSNLYGYVTFSPPKPAGKYSLYKLYDAYSYTGSALSNALCLKFAEYNILRGTSNLISLNQLYKLFIKTTLYAVNLFAKEYTVYNEFNPMHFCVDMYSASPLEFTSSYSVTRHTSSNVYNYNNRIIKRCGLRLRTTK